MTGHRYVAVDTDHVVYVFDCRDHLEVSVEYQDVASDEYTIYDEQGAIYLFDVDSDPRRSASGGRYPDLTAPLAFRLSQAPTARRPDALREALVRHITRGRRSTADVRSRSLSELVDLAAAAR